MALSACAPNHPIPATQVSGAGFSAGSWSGTDSQDPNGPQVADIYNYAILQIGSGCTEGTANSDIKSALSSPWLWGRNAVGFWFLTSPTACGSSDTPTQWGEQQAIWAYQILQNNGLTGDISTIFADVEPGGGWSQQTPQENQQVILGFLQAAHQQGFSKAGIYAGGSWPKITGLGPGTSTTDPPPLETSGYTTPLWLSATVNTAGSLNADIFKDGLANYPIFSWQYGYLTSTPQYGGCDAPAGGNPSGGYPSFSRAKVIAAQVSKNYHINIPAYDVWGNTVGNVLCTKIVGLASNNTTDGYWEVSSGGSVFNEGSAPSLGSLPGSGIIPTEPIVGIAATPDGGGYWLVASNGAVFGFGDAVFYGGLPGLGIIPAEPIVGIASTPDGKGYWLVGADGGVFSFGDAVFYGSCGDISGGCQTSIVGMAARSDGKGYWLVGANGGVFSFGDIPFYGSCGDISGGCQTSIVGTAATSDGEGYWLVGANGSVYTFGNATYNGTLSTNYPTYSPAGYFPNFSFPHIPAAVSGFAVVSPGNLGYWMVNNQGSADIYAFGDAVNMGTLGPQLSGSGSNTINLPSVVTSPQAYVAEFDSNSVTPINLATNTSGTPITVGANPTAIAITPDGKTAYVANSGSGTITPISTATNTSGTPIAVGANPAAIAITPDGKTAYVANSGSGTITPISTATNTSGTPITVGANPAAIAITPDGKTAYVASLANGTITPISTATNTSGTPITVGANPAAIAITPDGKTAYVANPTAGVVTPVNLVSATTGIPIYVGGSPVRLGLTPNGKMLYVSDLASNTVIPIPTSTNIPSSPIIASTHPLGIAIQPYGYLTVSKSGNDTPFLPLSKAVFSVTNSAGNPVGTFTTNAAGTSVNPPLPLPVGGYNVKEVTPPAGYKSSVAQEANVTFAKTTDVNFSDSAILGHINIRLIGNDTPFLPTSSAVFTVTKNANPNAGTTTTLTTTWDSSCKCADVTSGALLPGYYTVGETNPPLGYQGVAPQQVAVEPDKTDVASFYNKAVDGGVTVALYGNDTPFLPTSGASISLTRQDGPGIGSKVNLLPIWDSSANVALAVLNNVLPGNYVLDEITSPVGYRSQANIDITVSPNQHLFVPLINHAQTVSVSLRIQGFHCHSLNGASFVILGPLPNNTTFATTTVSTTSPGKTQCVDNNGTASVEFSESFIPGNYRLFELSAPHGYGLANPMDFTVNANQQSSLSLLQQKCGKGNSGNGSGYGNSGNNKKTKNNGSKNNSAKSNNGTVSQDKVQNNQSCKHQGDGFLTVALAGNDASFISPGNATFSVYDTKGKLVGTLTTATNGITGVLGPDAPPATSVVKLKPGSYKVVETAPPAGYELPTSAFFTTVQVKRFTLSIARFSNQALLGSLAINLFGNDTPFLPVSGAAFVVYNSYGSSVGDIVTNTLGQSSISGLLPGPYTVTEAIPPNGYLADGTQVVELTQATTTTAKFTNTAISGDIIVIKLGDNTPLFPTGGAVLSVQDYSGTTVGALTTVWSENCWCAQSNILTGLLPQSYTVEEVTPPLGYLNALSVLATLKPTVVLPVIILDKTNGN